MKTTVPEGATAGPIEVTAKGSTAKGPEFDVITTGTLKIEISNNRPELEPDGFDVLANGKKKVKTDPEGITLLKLEEGSYDVELSDLINFCSISGKVDQSAEIAAGDTTSVAYDIECRAVLDDQIAYIKYENDTTTLFVMDSDGSNGLKLGEQGSSMPDISPDGTKIAFVKDHDIFIINADGSNATNLTNSLEEDANPDWSPDGAMIAFSTLTGNNNHEIVTIKSDGTGFSSLTDATYDDDFDPSWSPDGKTIIFLRSIASDWIIYKMNADGSNQQRMFENISTDAFDPSWSPNGDEIAFAGRQNGSVEIFLINPDGTNERTITGKSPDIGNPLSWSPDGTKLLYYNVDTGMFKIDLDGANEIRLRENKGSLIHVHPDWGPKDYTSF